MDSAPLRVALLHVVPSVWINGGMLYNLFRAVFTPGGEARGPATRSRREAGHHCRQCDRYIRWLPLPFLAGNTVHAYFMLHAELL